MAKNVVGKNTPQEQPLLMEGLAALAQQRSDLLANEARIWRELGRILSEHPISTLMQTSPQRDNQNPDIMAETLMPVPRAAEYLSLSKHKLDEWRITGGGPEFVRLGRRIFYRRSALDQFIASNTYAHTSAYPFTQVQGPPGVHRK